MSELKEKLKETVVRLFTGELVANSVEDLAEQVMREADEAVRRETGGLCRVTGSDHDYGVIRLYVCCGACSEEDEYAVDIEGDPEFKMTVREVNVW
jgi:hypothetical protein